MNGHIDDTVRNIRRDVGYAQPPQLFLNNGRAQFREVAAETGGDFSQPRVGRGLAYGDFDRDGDLDVLITTNNGPAFLFRNDQTSGNRSIRFTLTGTKSNRDAIGATVRIFYSGMSQSRMVKGGSQLPLAIGVAGHVWTGQRGPYRASGDLLAKWGQRGTQESRCRQSL